jgi:Novel STAND NTPase 1
MAAADHKPYVGPRPFGRDEEDLFFGRDRETRDLCSLVVAHPIVLLYAASGAGKSSLLNAGLIPLLEARGYDVLPPARVSGQIPDAIKTTEVGNVYAFNVLSSWAGPSVDLRDVVKVDIAGFLASRPHRKDAAGEPVLRVILLDQFEELFTFAPEHWQERAELIRQLAEALERDRLLRIVLVMRRESVAQLETYAPLLPQGLRARFALDQLRPKAAQEAIEGPLARTDRKIEPEASQRLVEKLRKITVRGAGGDDVETVDPCVEPVQLQVACAKLWDDLPPDVHTITPAHIETYGDVDKTLMRFYEDALNAAATKTGVSNDRLRLWVDRYLITPGGTRDMIYRGPESTGREDNAIPNAAVDVLEEKHLIRAEARAGGERWYELTHDRFVGPIKDSNRVWREAYDRRQRQRKLLAGVGASVGVALVGILFYATWTYLAEYQRTDGAIDRLLALNMSDPETARRKAPAVLGDVADYLWQKDKLDHLTELLNRAAPVITEYYRMDPRMGAVMPQIGDKAPWPIELRYHPDRSVDTGRLLYEWRITAARLMDTRGIPVPATLKLTQDRNVPVDGLVVVADELKTSIEASTLRGGFVLVSESEMPKRLQAWFVTRKIESTPVEALKDGGPWWLVPRWTQPLFEAAGHPPSPREAVIALAVEQTLTSQPEVALNPKNVGYLLRRLQDAGLKRTVAEALASRDGIDGLVDDLRAVIRRGYPLVKLEYVLDSLAAYPRSQFSSAVVAEHVEKDQAAATPRAGARLTGAPVPATATAIEPLAEVARAEDIVPYRDMADRVGSQPPLRVYLGKDLFSYFVTPEGEWRPQILEKLNDLRGDLFKRFGIAVPHVKFDSDPVGNLAPNAFRVELLNRRSADKDTIAVEVTNSRRVVEQFLDELGRQLLAWRTRWITADYLERQLAHSEQIKTWLLSRYSLTDIKSLLRGVLMPSEAELSAYNAEGADGALRRVAPGQSLRELEWLLGSLVFWSQAGDGLDTAQLVRALQDTQAARLAPNQQPLPDRPAMEVLAGIDALEQGDFPRAEGRFRDALAADRSGAIATFLAAYASRDAVSMKGELKKLTQACVSFKPPGELNKPRSIEEQIRFEIEDFLARHQDSIAGADRVRLEYCLLEHYAASNYSDHVRTGLKLFNTPRYSTQLEPNQKYALGYWTLELSGRSFDPPPEEAAAEDWLASAFREWKETEEDDDSAEEAFTELWSRYAGRYGRLSPPRWYVDLLQRLGERRPKNTYIAYVLGITLSGGRDDADVNKGLFWLERARERIDGPAVEEADRPRLKAWIDYGVAKNYSAKALVSAGKARQEAAQEATSRLKAVIQRVKKDGFILKEDWPGALAYATLMDIHLFRNEIDEAARLLDDLRDDGLTERPELGISRFFLLLAAGRTDEALQFAERARELPGFEADALMLAAWWQLVTDRPEAEYAARKFLATTHQSRDYIRLMLYWHLAQNGKIDQAKVYLDERWRGINPASWPARLAQGNVQVWRERLIGYYLGKVKRDDILVPLRSREAFQSSELSRIGMSYEDIYSEAHFYDALLQAVTGDPATRSARFTQAIQHVLEVGHGGIYEYLMARYLRSRG